MTDDIPRVAVPQPPVSDVEPFLLDVFNRSWSLFKREPTLLIVGGAVATLVAALSLTLLAGPLVIGFCTVVHRLLHGQSARIRDVFEFGPRAVGAVVAWLLVAVSAAIGLALALIPGLLVLVVCCFTWHEIGYRGLTAIEAIKGSFAICKAYLLHVLLLLVGLGVLNAVGCISLFASLISVPFSLVLLTVAYETLSGQTRGEQIALVD